MKNNIKTINFEQVFEGLSSVDESNRKLAVATLYDTYNKKFTRELQYKFNNLDPYLIEDIVQDSFLKIIEKKAKPKAVTSITGWLRTIVFNSAIDKCRQFKNKHLEDSIDQEDDENKSILDKEELSTTESINTRDCIHEAYKNYAEKHSEEFEIFSAFITVSDSSQKSLSDLYGKSLSAIKKICTQTQKALESLIDPCLE